jgi:hypothetical protein
MVFFHFESRPYTGQPNQLNWLGPALDRQQQPTVFRLCIGLRGRYFTGFE